VSPYYKLLVKDIVLNIFNILRNLFILSAGIANILDSQLRMGAYATYVAMTQPFLSLND
jgi:hypothetical protein